MSFLKLTLGLGLIIVCCSMVRGQDFMDRKISDKGFGMIKRLEGIRSHVYNDGVGILTGGVGHRLTEEEKKRYRLGSPIAPQQIDEWLKHDLEKAEECVNEWVTVEIGQSTFDALVSFCFNVGCTAFKASKVLRRLNLGSMKEASEEFGRWVYARGHKLPGLVARRAEEAKLFLEDQTEAQRLV